MPRRSQRTRSVLTFIAQDGQQRTILYANAELTARAQSGEVIEFCRFYERTHGQLPKLLVLDQKLTTQEHLAELDELGVGFITLRQRSPKLIAALQALPPSAWTKTRLDRSGKHKTATYHDQAVTIKGRTFRQIAVNGLGREQATLILTDQQQTTVKQLEVFRRPPASLEEVNNWSKEWAHGITLEDHEGTVIARIPQLPGWRHPLTPQQQQQLGIRLRQGQELGQQLQNLDMPVHEATRRYQRGTRKSISDDWLGL